MSDVEPTTTPGELVAGLPTPRYGVGDSFWVAAIETETSQLPCPDCLGSREWKVTSPVGIEHTLVCPRCSNQGYSYLGGDRVPSLTFVKHVGVARRFTVGGIDVRSHGHQSPGQPDQRVSYYSSPNGGSTYYEYNAYDKEETALTAAQLRAQHANEKIQKDVEHLKKLKFQSLRFNDAILVAANDTAIDAWWAYRFLYEDVETSSENDGAGWQNVEELCTELKRHLDRDLKHREQYRPPSIVPLYDLLVKLLAGFAEVNDEHLAWLIPEEIAKRSKAVAELLPEARRIMHDWIEEARR